MAALNYAPSTHSALGLRPRISAWFQKLGASIVEKRTEDRTRLLLTTLSDRELNDIGLSRCDIERTVRRRRCQ